MNTTLRPALLHTLSLLLLASCGMQQTAQRTDDVYFVPSDAAAEARAVKPDQAPPAQAVPDEEDYYDEGTAQQFNGRSYYDMAYNDPYFYNYGRFGFGSGLAFQNGPMWDAWGRPAMWGYGSGVYGGWFRPGFNLSVGWGRSAFLWGMAYDLDPWMMGSPWFNGSWGYYGNWGGNPWGYGGWGYGNYFGPYGSCACCYTPIIIGGSANSMYGHRPSLGSGASASGNTQPRRIAYRDPIGLSTTPNRAPGTRSSFGDVERQPTRQGGVSRSTYRGKPTYPTQRPAHREPAQRPNFERQSPTRREGGFERSSGGSASPSRSNGGGGSSPSPGVNRRR